ncbi:MAG: DUF4249 domain-containing protein [Balneolia bacterium]|nr:DUF4249 domain-containing protein [Balneolia bacterium]
MMHIIIKNQLSAACTFFVGVMTLLTLTACDPYSQDSFVEQMVVESFFTGGEPLPDIKLSRTLPFDQPYTFEAAALSGYDIRVILTTNSGETDMIIQYEESENPGIYLPSDESLTVEKGRVYLLEVREAPGLSPVMTAETFVPGDFELVSTNGDSFIYQGAEQFEPTFTLSFYPGRQNYYVASTLALDPENSPLTPFYAGFLDDDEDPLQFRRVSSGIINESNYEINPDGTTTVKLPWVAIAFYGPNEVSFFSIDTNLYDYIRSQSIQLGGPSTLSPGQIENVLWNVEGGIGIFGSRTGIVSEIEVINPFAP